ncbi:MAG TPA: GYF domain-containing protein [Polyangiaceae bacterium]|nr:GYF domain-containing protein [Polyangiaceae bacterium]
MPYSVRCKACSTTFAIPDEIWNKRVKGHVATLKCRSCKAEIEVDGTKPHTSQFPSAPANVIPSSPTTAAADRTATVPKETTKNQPQLQSTVVAGSAAKSSASSKATQPVRPAASVGAAQPAGPAAVSNASQASAAASVSSKTSQVGGVASGAASGAASATATEIASANASSSVAAKPPTAAQSPAAKTPTIAQSPAAKSAQEIAAADTGWSLVPPPAELARVGLGTPTKAEPEKSAQTKTDDLASADVGWSLAPPPAELARVGIDAPTAEGVTGAKPKTAGTTASMGGARTQQSPTLGAAKALVPTPASAPKASAEPSTDVVSSAPQIEPTPEPDLNDLWVVSYGDDDDRELTEEQIASELGAGKITLSTIVWHDGMPEWLPISGIAQLSKYAPAPKPSPVRPKSSALTKTPSRVASSPTASLTPKLPSTATSNKLTPAASGTSSTNATSGPSPSVARSTLQKPEAPPVPLSAVPKVKTIPAEVPEANVAEIPAPAESQARQPPPLPKSTAGNKPVARDPKVLEDEVTVIYRPNLKSTGGHPPALPRRERPQASPETPWEAAAQNTDEVVTSAPRVAAGDDAPAPTAPAVASTASAASAPGFPVPSAVPRKVEGGSPRAAGPSAKPSPIKSSPPPKPVETPTSTVTHTEASSNVHTQLINDAEFLAMQRRLPKWAVPVAVAGAVVLIGLLIWAFSSGEEQPTVTVTPVVPVAPSVTEKPIETPRQAEARAPAVPTSAPTPTPGNSNEKDFARLFAQSVAKATGRFDAKAAERIATSAVDAAARCRHAPEPAGQARAVVTFATSGQVLSVQMGAPYINNSPTGKCIETALSTIKLPPFQGQPGRLSLTVAIR